jgi:hypothetical protein
MGNQASRIQERLPPPLPPAYENVGKILIQKVFNKSDSSFTAPRLGHSVLWEMRKDGQKEGTLIIIPFFN